MTNEEKELEKTRELEDLNAVMKDSTLSNPELTFCEKTTYLDFLLSNAKDDTEKKQIKETLDDYLKIYNATNKEEEKEKDE